MFDTAITYTLLYSLCVENGEEEFKTTIVLFLFLTGDLKRNSYL